MGAFGKNIRTPEGQQQLSMALSQLQSPERQRAIGQQWESRARGDWYKQRGQPQQPTEKELTALLAQIERRVDG